jgi:capsular polysaccharide export protein
MKTQNAALLALKGAKRILLLQGPLGPFFGAFASILTQRGKTVTKLNFNGGDQFFYPHGQRAAGDTESLTRTITSIIESTHPEVAVLFGQDRPVHVLCRKLLEAHQIPILVFEEGYVRPYFVTFERGGVNGRSPFKWDGGSADPDVVWPEKAAHFPISETIGHAIRYYAMMSVKQFSYGQHEHHRQAGSMAEAMRWVRGAVLTSLYRKTDTTLVEQLKGELFKRYYFVPLQSRGDAQISHHSTFASIEDFITQVLHSFASSAPAGTHLVLKHHPLDVGHADFGRLLESLSKQWAIHGRVHYLRSGHLPTILQDALGTVTINSTVGLSSLFEGTPVKTCGKAIYDVAGLSFQGDVDHFWHNPGAVDREAVAHFRDHLIAQTQLPGTFYWASGDYGGLLGAIDSALQS